MRFEEVARIVQIALLGEVSPALRGVEFGLEERDVRIIFYYDGPISEADSESASEVGTEVIAALPEDYRVADEVIRLDAPARMPVGETWAYRRRE